MKSNETSPLSAHHQHLETVRQNRWPRVRIVCACCWRRAEFRGHQKNLVRLGIERHGARAALGGSVLDSAEFVWGIFVGHREHAFTAGCEREACLLIECVGVDTFPDGKRRDYFSVVSIDYRHQFVVATSKQPAIVAVDGQSAWLFAGLQRPR